jgi:hypothetical protein
MKVIDGKKVQGKILFQLEMRKLRLIIRPFATFDF